MMAVSTYKYWMRILCAFASIIVVISVVWTYANRGPVSIQPIREFQVHGPVLSVAVGPKHELVAAGTAGLDSTLFGPLASKRTSHGELTIWREQDGQQLHRRLENQWITSIAFIPNRDEVVYGKGYCRVAGDKVQYPAFGTRGEIVILRTTDFSEVRRISLDSAVYCLRASPRGKYLAVASAHSARNTFLKVYDAQSLEIVLDATFTGEGPFMTPNAIEYRPMSNLSFSSDEQLMAVGVNDPTPQIVIYDLPRRRQLIQKALPQKYPWRDDINVVAFGPDIRTLLVLARPIVSRWKIDLANVTLTLESIIAERADPLVLPIGNRGDIIYGPGHFGGTPRISAIAGFYDPTYKRIGTLVAPVHEYTLSFAISADQKRAVAGDSDGKVYLWSLGCFKSYFHSAQDARSIENRNGGHSRMSGWGK